MTHRARRMLSSFAFTAALKKSTGIEHAQARRQTASFSGETNARAAAAPGAGSRGIHTAGRKAGFQKLCGTAHAISLIDYPAQPSREADTEL